jgi:hypothetical protein
MDFLNYNRAKIADIVPSANPWLVDRLWGIRYGPESNVNRSNGPEQTANGVENYHGPKKTR